MSLDHDTADLLSVNCALVSSSCSSPDMLPSSSTPSSPRGSSSTDYLGPALGIEHPISVDYLLEGLEFPPSLGSQVAVKVASAYADDNFKIYRAEVEIARRNYHKHSLAAQVAKMHLLKLEKKLNKAAHDATWFHAQASAVPDIDDPEWLKASAEVLKHFVPQAPTDSDTLRSHGDLP